MNYELFMMFLWTMQIFVNYCAYSKIKKLDKLLKAEFALVEEMANHIEKLQAWADALMDARHGSSGTDINRTGSSE